MVITIVQNGYILDCKEHPEWEKASTNKQWDFLYHLALKKEETEDNALSYLVKIAGEVIALVTSQPDAEFQKERISISFSTDEEERLLSSHPYILGQQYLTEDWLAMASKGILSCYQSEIAVWKGTVESYFAQYNPDLKIAERIYFHLVENKDGPKPFAFMATYANREAKHVPLARALQEYKKDQDALIKLLAPLSKVAGESVFINSLLETGELFKPIMLDEREALTFLKEIPIYQAGGICCRIPDFWKRKATRPHVSVSVGKKNKAMFGVDSLLDYEPEIIVDGVKLTRKDLQDLINGAQGLRMIKGKWVEVDKEKLQELLQQYDAFGKEGNFTFADMSRDILGVAKELPEGVEISNGQWLKELLAKLKNPAKLEQPPVPGTLHATLRPYQEQGYAWLSSLYDMGFGSCLADDMGLGKTVQVLALTANLFSRQPCKMLLVVPPSLAGNWEKETERFLPTIKPVLLTGPSKEAGTIDCSSAGLYITTYPLLGKLQNAKENQWDLVVIDEAQAIKNSSTGQAKAVKALHAGRRIALTGTPVENNLGDLWSIFDWLDPGLLGTKKEFNDFSKTMEQQESYERLRRIVSPFILRRMKSDKTVISDLPEKLEETEYPLLTKIQAKLYEKVVGDLEKSINETDGIERKGVVLASILKFKQICNHPSQYEGSDEYDLSASGKFQMLQSICEQIARNHERVLVFTQFREIIPALDACLTEVFDQKGLVLHGGTPVKDRTKLVAEFNDVHYCPYMVLSLKAGGTGLNLTAANHVIHFDRWWNPAVENQATDRAYRIGQKKNVVVHTFVTKGTIEEKIDRLLSEKRKMSEEILSSSGEGWIANMSNEQIMDICSLDGGHR